MNKDIHIIAGSKTETYAAFRDRILAAARKIAESEKPDKIWLTITEEAPPLLSVIPFKKRKIAAISVTRSSTERIVPGIITSEPGFRFASAVSEATPVAYVKTWPDGTVTPGVCLLTIFRKKPGISQETFISRWHGSHTPLSLRIHPLWHYNRNVILSAIAGTETGWGGIVEEHFRSRSDLLNPFRFFGKPPVIIQRMVEVYRDTRSFLDYGTIETYMVREYHIKG